MRRSFCLLLAVAAAVGLAGCGGSSTISLEDYTTEVVRARDRVDAALDYITNTQERTKDVLIERMKESAEVIERAAGDLDDAGAAEGFEDETDQLVAAFEQLAVDLDQTARQLEVPGFDPAGTQGLSFESWVEANRVLNSLKDRGIRVQPLGRH